MLASPGSGRKFWEVLDRFSETLGVSSCGRSYALVGALRATGALFRSAIRIRTSLPFIRNYGNNGTERLYCFKPRKNEL